MLRKQQIGHKCWDFCEFHHRLLHQSNGRRMEIFMKESRRVSLTKKMLRDSLCQLLIKNNIQKISIKQICEVADVNRTTFYAHYCDRYELLRDVENEVEKGVAAEINRSRLRNASQDSLLELFFKYIRDNIEKVRLIFKNTSDGKFAKSLAEISVRLCVSDEKLSKLKEETREFIYQYIINGSLSIIEKFVGNEINKTPKELAAMFRTLVNGSVSAFCCA